MRKAARLQQAIEFEDPTRAAGPRKTDPGSPRSVSHGVTGVGRVAAEAAASLHIQGPQEVRALGRGPDSPGEALSPLEPGAQFRLQTLLVISER